MGETHDTHSPSTRSVPLDPTHHFARATRKRVPNVVKDYYRFLTVPGMGSLAGGLPFPGYFPIHKLDLTITTPGSGSFSRAGNPSFAASDAAVTQLEISRTSKASNPIHRIDLDSALQYGIAQGYTPLYAWLKKLTNTVYHPNIPYSGGAEVVINGGSADGLAKIYEVLFNSFDEEVNETRDREGLFVEEFVYPPPILQTKAKDINIVPIKLDEQGMVVSGDGGLLETVEQWDFNRGKCPHALYTIPTGQNPTAGVLSPERRKQIYEVCSRFDIIIIEDDPYWNLFYPRAQQFSQEHRGEPVSSSLSTDPRHDYCTQSPNGLSTGHRFLDELVPSFLSIDTDGRVIRLDTFSKTIAPGCRLGWITAQPSICEQLIRVTDASTQQPSGFVQAIVGQLIGGFEPKDAGLHQHQHQQSNGSRDVQGWGVAGWVRWLEDLRDVYERRMIAMAMILEKNRHTNDTETEMFTFNWPMAGMFLWVKVSIANHPLASLVDAKRLMFALWISCTQAPYLVLLNPGKDFGATDAIRDRDGYLFLRFCFAAVDESVLTTKTHAFVDACRHFWALNNVGAIDHVLRDEDTLDNMGSAARAAVELERMTIEDW